jgi:hypothetical protein
MSVVAPPEAPQSDDLEALIREARTRQRRRWIGAAAVTALLAGAAVGVSSFVSGGGSTASTRSGDANPVVKTGNACGVRVVDTRIVGAGGRTLYREPGNWSPGHPRPRVVRCSGPTIWIVWDNGAGMMQEAYVGARSADRGRTWKTVFAERFFDVKAPHELDAYLGPWTLRGRTVAYFAGSCPACSAGDDEVSGTVSLWVTKDSGRSFHEYTVPALDGYAPTRIRVSGDKVTIFGRRFTSTVPPRRTATVRVS